MASVLLEKRLSLGKQLSEIAAVTRVRTNYLKAIEEEQYDELPIPVYTRGYIREFARALDVDPAAALQQYDRFLAGPGKEAGTQVLASPSDNSAVGSSLPNAAPSPAVSLRVTLTAEREIQLAEATSGKRSLKMSLAFFAALVIVGGVVLYQMFGGYSVPVLRNPKPDVILKEPVVIKPSDEQAKPADTMTLQSPAAAKPEPQQASIPAPLPTVTQQSGAPAAQKPSVTAKKHQLMLTAVDKVWVQVILDRTDKMEMLLNPGDTQRFDAQENVRLWIGNAAGLKIAFDGKEIAHGGKSGQSLRLVLPEAVSPNPQLPAQ
ncbi:MAG TPA: RodZ domain-containing protein [Dissulfurispiraceae bacterium]|nr:RodZ domain-containing protein [Dissulfurispiraceae bacterium]